MPTVIGNFRKRTGLTQQDVANMLHTDKSNISHIESKRRDLSQSMYEAGFKNIPDAQMLNDMAHLITQGFTIPSPSNKVYDDHRLALGMRMKREMREVREVMQEHCLDKHPEYLTRDEKEEVMTIASEVQDVLFEAHGFLMKLINDYDFITPQKVNQNRDARLKMERRI